MSETQPHKHATSATPEPTIGFDLFSVWKEYEAIAMHFNDLLMRLRSQSLAAVAAFAAIAGVVLQQTLPAEMRWGALAAVFFLLILFWIAIWCLDFLYYNRLLLGAVDALLRIERLSRHSNRVGELEMSTLIEKAVRVPSAREAQNSESIAGWRALGWWSFYTVVFLTLVLSLVVCLIKIERWAGIRHLLQPAEHHAQQATTDLHSSPP